MRILVAYFSASGITREVAEKIAAVAGEGGASVAGANGVNSNLADNAGVATNTANLNLANGVGVAGANGADGINLNLTNGANSNLAGVNGANSNLNLTSTDGGNLAAVGVNSNLTGGAGGVANGINGANSNLTSTETNGVNSNLADGAGVTASGANIGADTATNPANPAAKNQVALFEIAPAVPYSAADLDWTNPRSRTTIECKDKSCRPPLARRAEISGFDAVIIGFPVWWYTAPNVIFTFLESADFGGKIIVPFCTSGGSGLDPAPRDMQKSAPTARFLQGRRFNFGEGKSAIRKWLAGLGLI